jgi:hypothetical protein
MPRHFFHVVYGPTVVRDDEGILLQEFNAAEVQQSFLEVLREHGEQPESFDEQRLEVANEDGEMVMTVPFDRASRT